MVCGQWQFWPGKMLFTQPRVQSSSEHSCYLFAMFDFAKIFSLAKQRIYQGDKLTF